MPADLVDRRPRRAAAALAAAGTGPALRHLLQRFRTDRPARVLIVGLLAANLACLAGFVLVHVVFRLDSGFWADPAFDLTEDRSLPEMLGYLQTLACAACLGGTFSKTRQPVFAAWMLIFLFVLADDALSVHERLGWRLGRALGLPALGGLRPQDGGELLVWSLAAVVLLGILARALRRSDPAALGYGGVFALLFAGLVFFAAGVDMAHIALGPTPPLVDDLIGLLEDGGEMLMLALAASAALLLYRTTGTGVPGP